MSNWPLAGGGSDSDFDAAVLSLQHLEAAVAAGKHVYCESRWESM